MGKFKAEVKMIDGEKWIKFNSEFEEKRYFHGNVIMGILGVILMLFMFWLGFTLLTHIDEIQANPFVYGLSKLDVEGSCMCSFNDEQGTQYESFWANSTNWGFGLRPTNYTEALKIEGSEFEWGAYGG